MGWFHKLTLSPEQQLAGYRDGGERPHSREHLGTELVKALQSTSCLGRMHRDEETAGNGKDSETQALVCRQLEQEQRGTLEPFRT